MKKMSSFINMKSATRITGLFFVLVLVSFQDSQHVAAHDATVRPPHLPPMVTIRLLSGQVTTIPYENTKKLQDIVNKLNRLGGGLLEFEPRVYEFDRVLRLWDVHNVHFQGKPGTTFRMRKLDEFGILKISQETLIASKRLIVNRPDLVRPGTRYQLLRPNLKGIRMMEFDIATIDGNVATIANATNISSKEAMVGAFLMPHINFIGGWRCGDMSFDRIIFDGNFDMNNRKLGEKNYWAHTTHCGILLRNGYTSRPGRPVKRPSSSNVRITNCTFKNLLGRGTTFYNMANVTVRGCHFEDMGAEAIEIDHLSSFAVISGCTIRRAKFGMRLNDCTDVTVTGCVMQDCEEVGVFITDVVRDPSCNRRMSVTGNTIYRGRRGIVIDPGAEENIIANNTITDMTWCGIYCEGNRNVIQGNSIRKTKQVGVIDKGQGNLIVNNLILNSKPSKKWSRIKKND